MIAALPATVPVEVCEHDQEPVRRGVNMSRERCDFVAEPKEIGGLWNAIVAAHGVMVQSSFYKFHDIPLK